MEKRNYQQETERTIERLCEQGERPPLLLHACCAPCSSYVLEYLTRYFTITLFFCNPNITEPEEYRKRLAELRRLCAEAPFCGDVTVVEDPIASKEFLQAAAGLEDAAEGGARCERCFRLRLERTAEYAKKNDFPLFLPVTRSFLNYLVSVFLLLPVSISDMLQRIWFVWNRQFHSFLPCQFYRRFFLSHAPS